MKKIKFTKFLFVAVVVISLMACNPFKITDPANPGFDVKKFDFNDYKNHEEMAYAIRFIIHKGESKASAEKVLVVYGGADRYIVSVGPHFSLGHEVEKIIDMKSLLRQSHTIIQYGHDGNNPKFFWQIYFFYDENENVIQAIVGDEIVFVGVY